jgi:hypothetical protein
MRDALADPDARGEHDMMTRLAPSTIPSAALRMTNPLFMAGENDLLLVYIGAAVIPDSFP